MGTRVVYGNDHSSNGWPMVDEGSCTWVTVPGTSVSLEIQNGQPLQILSAFVADINAYVEPVRDADTACWTATNSVSTSNHLSGTAVDIDWESHPFRIADAGWSPPQIATIREIQDFYEGTVFWGNDWTNPKDAMHFQLASLANGGDIDTFNNPHTADFIARKIRADGFSMFRRGAAPPSKMDRYALAVIDEGRKRHISVKGICIALTVPFVESGWKMYANSNVAGSEDLPHDAVGHDHDSTGLFQQRQAWGPLTCTMDAACSAGLFYDGGKAGQRGLIAFDYNSDTRTPGGWAQAVQVSAFPDRYDAHFGEAVTLYNRLAGVGPPPPPPSPEEDFLSALTADEQRALYNEIMLPSTSVSPFRPLGQGPVGNLRWFVKSIDGSEHVEIVEWAARHGHPGSLTLLRQIADGDPARYPDRAEDIKLAQAVLADLAAPAGPPQSPGVVVAASQQPQGYPVALSQAEQQEILAAARSTKPAPAPLPVPVNGSAPPASTGEVIGKAYDALEKLRLADALPIESRAPLAALIAVLTTKNGAQL